MRRNNCGLKRATISVALLVGVTSLLIFKVIGKQSLQFGQCLNASPEKIGELISQDFEPPKDDGEPGPTAGGGTRNERRNPQTDSILLKHLLKSTSKRSAEFILQT